MRSRSHERSRRSSSSQHHEPSRSHSHNKNRGYSRRASGGNNQETRSGLRIFVGTANLGHSLPDEDSLAVFLPHHGKVKNVINFSVKSSSIMDGVSKASWNNINTHGKLEVVAIGLQEATSSGNIITTSGITAKLTGNSIKERNNFSKAPGSTGKPLDELHCMASDFMANAVKGEPAELGGTKKLKEMIIHHIGDDYTLLAEFQRGEVVLYLFVRNDLAPSSKVTELKGENVGVDGIMANKCGIAALLSVGDTRLSFICAHLNAHEGNYQSRNSSIAEILSGTNDPTLTSHHSFVFGDLNYRCALPRSSKGEALTKEEAKIVSQKMVSQRDWDKFNELDELRKALDRKDILVGFNTPHCKFPPTFKVEKREGFHYNFQRTPSYTDRVLWKSNEDTRHIEPIIYEAASNFTTSDHKPVRGLFFLPSRPSLKLDLEKTLLNIELSQIQCRGLKPEESLFDSDLNTFMRVRCEPSHLLKLSTSSRLQTDTIKSTDRPFWRKCALQFQVNVLSKTVIHGSTMYLESVQENMIAGSSVLGTVVFDLEDIIRKTLGAKERSEHLSCDLLRHSKCVGKLTCHLQISWRRPPVPHCSTFASEKSHTYRTKSESQSGSKDGSRVAEKVSNSPLRQRDSEAPAHRSKSKSHGEVKDENMRRRESTKSSTSRNDSSSSLQRNMSEDILSEYLTKLKLPHALLSAVKENYYSSSRRLWGIDNSSAMQIYDSRLIGDDKKVSRWEELCECVCFHAKMGARVGMETEFQLLNTSNLHTNQRFCVGSKRKKSSDEIEVARKTMEAISPTASDSPLVQYIQNFVKTLPADEVIRLRQRGKFISLILATQGVPSLKDAKSESDAFHALGRVLNSVNKLPVKLVIRLCTGDDETVRHYNEVLTQTRNNCDVLNDYEGEAMEVYLYNPWLTYSVGLHRLREAGLAWGMDMLDEKTFSFGMEFTIFIFDMKLQ
eukprot:CCRYP_014540-RB/>CCRYP_014540-RB protein AED:0.00 eAED:0.00 QI:623/1/1/1/0/0/2/709/952